MSDYLAFLEKESAPVPKDAFRYACAYGCERAVKELLPAVSQRDREDGACWALQVGNLALFHRIDNGSFDPNRLLAFAGIGGLNEFAHQLITRHGLCLTWLKTGKMGYIEYLIRERVHPSCT